MVNDNFARYKLPGLVDKVVAVTGGASGIGREISMTMGLLGLKVAVIDIDKEKGREITKELIDKDARAFFYKGDVSIEAEINECMDDICTYFGGLDILVNNAGITRNASFNDLKLEEWEKIILVNLTGTYICSKAAIQHMLKRGKGTIIMISSGSAYTGTGGSASYAASKGGIISLVRALSHELAPKGIRVNGVAPRSIKSELLDRIYTDEYLKKMVSEIPLGRMGTYEDVANVVAFLASDLSGFITGETILVDGGRTFGGLKL